MGKNNIFMPLKYESRFDRWEAEKVKAIIKAMFVYKRTGEVKKLPPEYMDAFDAIRDDMDVIEAAYEERCRKNAENGKKGGRPKKANGFSETERFLEKPKKALREENRREEKKREEREEEKQRFSPPFSPIDIKSISDILGG